MLQTVESAAAGRAQAAQWHRSLLSRGIFEVQASSDRLGSLVAIARLVAGARRDGNVDEDFLSFGLATEYLRLAVGNEWTNQVVFPQHPTVSRANRAGRNFMKTETVETPDHFRHQERVLRLAELLFNLHAVDGLDERLADLRAGKIEDTITELEIAAFLQSQRLNFRFLRRSGRLGHDYDGEIHLISDEAVCCEMKCKVEGTELGDGGTITNALNRARKQLPATSPCFVYLKVPETWASELDSTITPTVRKFLQNTSRVIAVTVVWEQMHRLASGAAFEYRFRLVPHPTGFASFSSAVQELLRLLSAPTHHDAPVTRFRAIAARVLAESETQS